MAGKWPLSNHRYHQSLPLGKHYNSVKDLINILYVTGAVSSMALTTIRVESYTRTVLLKTIMKDRGGYDHKA